MNDNWVDSTLEKMTLKEKAGQVLVIPLWSLSKDNIDTGLEILDKYHIGGRFVLGEEPDNLAETNLILQKESKIPLLIGSDLEMGPGQTLKDCCKFPSQMCRAACGDEELEYEIGKISALQGCAYGVNFTASPVLDANINRFCPDVNIRSYSTEPEKIISMSIAYIKGLQENGMLAQAKHYPGNGGAGIDQHIAPALVNLSKEEMYKIFLEPYRQAIKQAKLASVMVGHLEVPSLTNEINPNTGRPVVASVSSIILNDILRDELGFEGFAMSDALNMGGINNDFSSAEMAVRCINAGMDSLLAFNYADMDKLHGGIVEAVEKGQLAESKLDNAVRNILNAKARINLHKGHSLPASKDERTKIVLRNEEFAKIRKEVTSRAITVINNRDDLLPMDFKDKKVLVISSYGPDSIVAKARGSKQVKNIIPGLLEKLDAEVIDVNLTPVISEDLFNKLNSGLEDADIILINMFHTPSHAVGYNLFPNHNVVNLFYQGLFQRKADVIITAFGDPFVIDNCPSVPAFVCAYDPSEDAQQAAFDVWIGKKQPQGKSPVTFKYYYNYGDGLELKNV